MDNKFQLWSPPLLDLSLDSFSNDLIQEFDKTRTTNGNQLKKSDTTQEQLDSLEIIHNNNNNNNNNILSSSPIASSVTLPPSEREISFHEQEEDSSSTANLFRKSSTFLKKKLSQSGKKEENNSISSNTTTNTTNTTEDISNIISRQYPPKPLHYSPVVEPPSDTLQTTTDNESFMVASSSIHTNTLPRSIKDNTIKSHQNRMSNPISVMSTPTISTNIPVTPPTTATTTTTTTTTNSNNNTTAPKRRSFFSLRFC